MYFFILPILKITTLSEKTLHWLTMPSHDLDISRWPQDKHKYSKQYSLAISLTLAKTYGGRRPRAFSTFALQAD